MLLFWGLSSPMIHGLTPVILRAAFTLLMTWENGLRSVPMPAFLKQLIPLQHNINTWCAMAEVLTCFTLILYLVTPNRSIMFLFVYLQYVRMRYILNSPAVHLAFYRVGGVFNTIVSHRLCPGLIKRGYEWIRDKAWSFVDPAELQKAAEAAQNGGGGGLMSKCSIM